MMVPKTASKLSAAALSSYHDFFDGVSPEVAVALAVPSPYQDFLDIGITTEARVARPVASPSLRDPLLKKVPGGHTHPLHMNNATWSANNLQDTSEQDDPANVMMNMKETLRQLSAAGLLSTAANASDAAPLVDVQTVTAGEPSPLGEDAGMRFTVSEASFASTFAPMKNFVLFGGAMLSRSMGLGMVGYIAFQAAKANLSRPPVQAEEHPQHYPPTRTGGCGGCDQEGHSCTRTG